MELTWEIVKFEAIEEIEEGMKEEFEGVIENDRMGDTTKDNILLPSPFPPNLSLVLRLPVISIISPKAIIVLDKVVISSIPPNPPYYITIILIVSSDKDISPNTIIALDKSIPPNSCISS